MVPTHSCTSQMQQNPDKVQANEMTILHHVALGCGVPPYTFACQVWNGKAELPDEKT